MSDTAKKARAAMKAKAQRLGGDRPLEKVDSSSWTPPEMLNADVKTGLRPVSPRAYKRGGKVHGEHAQKRADRKPRKSGGEVKEWVNAKVNRNVKEANEAREGTKHVGGMKRGGSAKKALGGPLAGAKQMMDQSVMQSGVPNQLMGFTGKRVGSISPARGLGIKTGGKVEKHDDEAADKALIKKMVKPEARTGKKHGGERKARKEGGGVFSGPGYPGKVPGVSGDRKARATGGKTGKGKTDINIMVHAGQHPGMDAGQMPPAPLQPAKLPGSPGAMPVPTPPPAAGMPMGMPMGMPPAMMGAGMPPMPPAGGAPLPRKSGGRAYRSYKDMDAGAGGGEGRLEKTEIAKRKTGIQAA